MPDQLKLDLRLPSNELAAILPADEIYSRASVALLQALGEDRRIERKPATFHPSALGDYFSVFANTAPDGGIIVIGLEDNGAISGCTRLTQDQLNKLERTGDVYCPDARYDTKRLATDSDGKNDADFLLLLRVRYRPDRVVETVRGDAFIRRGESKKKLTADEKRELQISKGQIEFETEACDLDFVKDFDSTLIRQYTDSFRAKSGVGSLDDKEILILRHLGRETNGQFFPNIACALLFAHDPLRVIPGCKIRFLRFEGETEGTGSRFNAVKDITIEGQVPSVIVRTEKIVEAQIRQFTRLGSDGKFFTAPEYPKDAWYEAIVNACVHRSYNLRNMNIFVKMFDDRLVVESPGGFPPLVTPENIYDMHQPRNPHLMNAMLLLDFVQCAHEGTRRMRDTMAQGNLPAPIFTQKEVDGVLVQVTLKNNIAHRKVFVDADAAKLVGETIFRLLDQQERMVINFVAENRAINVSEVQRLTGKAWSTSRKILSRLVKKGILKHQRREKMTRDPLAHFVLNKPEQKKKES